MFNKVVIEVVDARQWLLGVRHAALAIHDEIGRFLEPILNGRPASIAERDEIFRIARDLIGQSSASMFMLLSALGRARYGSDAGDSEIDALPEIDNPDDLLQLISRYVESTSFAREVACQILSAKHHSGNPELPHTATNFEISRKALKALLNDIDRRLGIRHLDHQLNSELKSITSSRNRNLVS